jgi:hypothetical protein
MAKPVLLVENLFSDDQFTGHTVTAESTVTGFEAYKVATGRRSPAEFWKSDTDNQATWVKVQCDKVRAANMVVLDRGHNLKGESFTLECSNDNFTTTETVIDTITLPSESAPGGVDELLGVRTEEGAWVKRFGVRAAKYWRVSIPAMGSNKRPNIVGLWLGLSWEPRAFDLPWSDETSETVGSVTVSASGWEGGRLAERRVGAIGLRMDNYYEYDQARYHVQGLFAAREPMWMLQDGGQADRTILVIRPPGRLGFEFREDWWNMRRGNFQWTEHEPLMS